MTGATSRRTSHGPTHDLHRAMWEGKHIVFDMHIAHASTRMVKSPGADFETRSVERALRKALCAPQDPDTPDYHRVYVDDANQLSSYFEEVARFANETANGFAPRTFINFKAIVREAKDVRLARGRTTHAFLVSARDRAKRSIEMKKTARHINLPWMMVVPVTEMTPEMHSNKGGVLQLTDKDGRYDRHDREMGYWASAPMPLYPDNALGEALRNVRLVFQSKNAVITDYMNSAVATGNRVHVYAAVDERAVHRALTIALSHPRLCDTLEVPVILHNERQMCAPNPTPEHQDLKPRQAVHPAVQLGFEWR